MSASTKTLLILVNVDWFFLSHRLPIALEAKKRGYRVVIAADDTGKAKTIRAYGLEFVPLAVKRTETGILSNLRALKSIFKVYRKVKPDVIHNVSIKPVLYGSFIARLMRKKTVVNAISGMGYLFTNDRNNGLIMSVYKLFTKFAFGGKSNKFIIQNETDYNGLIELSGVKESKILLIPGSGIELSDFPYTKEPEIGPIKLLLHARMLWDKGVQEFVDMARILKTEFKEEIQCILCGGTDENRTSIPENQLQEWQKEGIINWIGHQTDIKSVVQDSHIIVFPSYREGFPKALIEASAIGRPIITTDAVGCRDAVNHQVNGFIVPLKNAQALAEKARILIKDKNLRLKMGIESRKIADARYSIQDVCNQTIEFYQS